jgi:hypothetical protein
MLLRIIAVLFGIAFIFAGMAGFLPSFTPNGLLLGLFEVDMLHNLIHLVSGVVAIMAATSLRASRLFFRIFGVLYALVTIAGFWNHGQVYIMHMNMADNFLHLVIAFVMLYLGFFMRIRSA